MFGKKIPLFKIFGFEVGFDFSWFLLVILITWSLASGLFPQMYEDLSTTTYWIMGVAGALGLFLSIVLHELGHSLVARSFGMDMRGITLFIFGGVAEMKDEPPSAKAEFYVAIAGPIVSVILGVALLGLSALSGSVGLPTPVDGVLRYLGIINLVLVAFNMIPAFPLDGGRVLRAIIWHLKGDLRLASKVTSDIGGGFGLILIALGVLSIVAGNFIAGVWWFILGMFLRGAARMSYEQVILRKALEGEPVSRFMTRNPVTVSPDISLRELVDEYFYQHQHKLYPVTDNGALNGVVTIADLKQVPREQWDSTQVGDVMRPSDETNTVSPNTDAMAAMSRLNGNQISRLVIAEGDQLHGVIALKDLMGFLSMKIDLEGE